MKRRAAIKKTTWILQAAVFGPGLIGAIQSCQPKAAAGEGSGVLSNRQIGLVKWLADTIIPKTDTPSASEVNVHRFLEVLLSDVFDAAVKKQILNGLDQFDEACQLTQGESFAQMDQESRNQYLDKIDREVMSKTYMAQAPFYYTMKQLVVIIYFSTSAGVKQNLDYRPVPGPFEGDVALGSDDSLSVGNKIHTYEQ